MFGQIRDAAFSDLVGKTIKEIRGAEEGSDEVMFVLDDGTRYRMHHLQDCCECVYLADVIGDILDVVGSPIVSAEEVSTSDGDRIGEYDDSFTWTFYKLDTVKGGVTLRWYGSSNGYYSERVSFDKLGYHK